MSRGRAALAVLVGAMLAGACEYVVVPPDGGAAAAVTSEGWAGVATAIGTTDDGDLRIDLAIENRTGDWSAMAAAEAPARLAGGDGSTASCDVVMVGTGGHRLAPGFRMRGFTGGTKTEPVIEPIRVECADAAPPPAGSKLAIDYTYVTGEYNYYDPEATTTRTTMEVPLDELLADLTYPVAAPVDGLIQPADSEITALNDVVLQMTGLERAGTTLEATWQTTNPGEYPTSVHIGEPPVIGSDGVIYGFYESPDLASVPITPPGATAEWPTEVDIPAEVTGLTMLLPVESKKQRLFVSHALDLGGT
ncbi:MAG TPA: hypothetical protein VIH00_05665 [Candidatus Limnocylindrales bacterium]